jgi:hypothetical protein
MTTDRGPDRYVLPEMGGADLQSVMSSGEGSDVSIHRVHPPEGAIGSSNSSGSQYAFKIKWKTRLSFGISAPKAKQ